jgi:cell division septation protein DedD
MERLRERHLSPGDRQVVVLALCALLLLSGVFTLGVLIGRKTAEPAPAGREGDLAALDAQPRQREAPRAAKAAPAAEPAPPAQAAPAATDKPEPARVEKPEPARAATIVPPPAHTPTVIPAPHPLPPPAVPDLPLSPPPRDAGDYTVQVGASQDRAEAARLLGRVRGAGLRPYVIQANLGAKGTWYRVRVGVFRDKESAARFRSDVERELRIAAVVMPTH